MGTVLLACATLGLVVVGQRTGKTALGEYQAASRREQAKWLLELFDRFYLGPGYRDVNLAFDGLNEPLMRKICAALQDTGDDAAVEWELTRYLNFFEFVATLVSKGDIDPRDADSVFTYAARRILYLPGGKPRDFVAPYLERNSYRHLLSFAKDTTTA
ncbi:MAG: hypothetical protein HY904_16050 [Deltaproteobacteria bacterium]|nr:hypothetical protein [Deltaproteobacteria bacterium]